MIKKRNLMTRLDWGSYKIIKTYLFENEIRFGDLVKYIIERLHLGDQRFTDLAREVKEHTAKRKVAKPKNSNKKIVKELSKIEIQSVYRMISEKEFEEDLKNVRDD